MTYSGVVLPTRFVSITRRTEWTDIFHITLSRSILARASTSMYSGRVISKIAWPVCCRPPSIEKTIIYIPNIPIYLSPFYIYIYIDIFSNKKVIIVIINWDGLRSKTVKSNCGRVAQYSIDFNSFFSFFHRGGLINNQKIQKIVYERDLKTVLFVTGETCYTGRVEFRWSEGDHQTITVLNPFSSKTPCLLETRKASETIWASGKRVARIGRDVCVPLRRFTVLFVNIARPYCWRVCFISVNCYSTPAPRTIKRRKRVSE